LKNNYLVIDGETTGATNGTKGNPFCIDNRLCYLGCYNVGNGDILLSDIEYSLSPYGPELTKIQRMIDEAALLVFFNSKFDLHWMRRYGLKFRHKPLFDTQLAEFILHAQRLKLSENSLDKACERRGLQGKLDVVKTEYWQKGIDTDMVPKSTLTEYLEQDLRSTGALALCQFQDLQTQTQLKRLVYNACQDLYVTEDMEWNGLHYNIPLSLDKAQELEGQVKTIDTILYELFPYDFLNWASPEQVSAILYGGDISYKTQETYTFIYKDGKKGPVEKTHWVEHTQTFPRIVEPLDNTKCKKEGVYSTDDGTLKKIKSFGLAKQVTGLLLERRAIEKKIGTYYLGIPKKYEEMKWQDSLIHTSLNHTVAVTGRLSSSGPNVQNLEEQIRQCFQTRFKSVPQIAKSTKLVAA
jgi:DNA polymerase I-like protein with 3'-5' exonuclease and polymerase domains